MIVTIDIPYQYGDILYLKSDPEQYKRLLIGVRHCADNGILLELQCGTSNSYHYPIEVTTERDILSNVIS